MDKCTNEAGVGKKIPPPVLIIFQGQKVKMYGVHVESDFVWQNSRWWQEILTLICNTLFMHVCIFMHKEVPNASWHSCTIKGFVWKAAGVHSIFQGSAAIRGPQGQLHLLPAFWRCGRTQPFHVDWTLDERKCHEEIFWPDKGKIMKRWQIVLVITVLFLSGCTHMGPTTVASDRFDYNTAI